MLRRTPLFICLGGALVALLALAPAASADQLVYRCGDDLCLINPDNPSQVSDLTNTAGTYESHPAWSPNGGLIAFDATYPKVGNETVDVYTLDPSSPGTAVDISNTGNRREGPPVWSPDGSELAFSAEPTAESNKSQVYIAPSNGTGSPVAIGTGSNEEKNPTWSSDGTKLAFNRSGETIYIAAAASGSSAAPLLSASGFEPVWSPDGRYIAGARLSGNYPYGVHINNAPGGGFRELAKPLDLGGTISWSCDSKYVTYVGDEVTTFDQVWVVPADGSGIGVRIPMPEGWIVPHNPKFSPDGTRVVFDARHNGGNEYEQLLIAPSNGSAVATPITSSESEHSEAQWKPTGAACAAGGGPVPTGPTTGTGTGTATGTGTGTKAGGGQTQAPVVVKLAYFNHPTISGGFMGAAGIDCNAPGGHPTGKVAEICAASGSAYTRGVGPAGSPRLAARAGPKKTLFAAGSVRVKAGKKGTLKLKITAAGKKLLVPGRKLKLTLEITTKNGNSKPKKSTKVVTVEVPQKRG